MFGIDKTYASEEVSQELGQMIEAINDNKEPGKLSTLINRTDLIFGCTEISMKAAEEHIEGLDTLQVTIEKIVIEL